jgi:glutamate/tyrosine decarboxylase-like PLP-dependent enzyme
MRLWFSLQVLGLDKIAGMVTRGFALADLAERELRKLPDWVMLAPTSTPILNFGFAPDGMSENGVDRIDSHISKQLAIENVVCILTTQLRKVIGFWVRTINPRTTDYDIPRVARALDRSARSIYEGLRQNCAN